MQPQKIFSGIIQDKILVTGNWSLVILELQYLCITFE
jgi:hypothetical protein